MRHGILTTGPAVVDVRGTAERPVDRDDREPPERLAPDLGAVPASVDQLAAATRRLAQTIAQTERLAQDRAELLRTADASSGLRSGSDGADLVSLSEAAKRTGRHPEVLRRWCIDGRLPAVRVGRTWAISRESLTTLMTHRDRSRPRLQAEATRR
jgi:excisionase family DNA binding protein